MTIAFAKSSPAASLLQRNSKSVAIGQHALLDAEGGIATGLLEPLPSMRSTFQIEQHEKWTR
jgi:hypothetical protein